MNSQCEIIQPLWQVFQYRHYTRMLSLFYYNNYVTVCNGIPSLQKKKWRQK